MKILLVDDDPLVAAQVTDLLTAHQYVVDWAKDGQTALSMSQQFEYDLLLLDILLPDMDGVEVCRQVRSSAGAATQVPPLSNSSVPILLLTVKDRPSDRVAGLTAGADDYLTKPYHPAELLARIEALLRRGRTSIQTNLCWGALRLDLKMAEVTYRGDPLCLTPKEYRLL